ncbi:MAG: 23S rRNA (adenine(2503)-C(2))-methyltransferase RlmN, partial [Pirellulaceae bacterium]|jgi:23S rRNA (adenine2503-C2)-methyltransferase|nr:23S rRNA (adenine(2503)-C(2))-methyltransferase RlmN [Pirellulaceae bacterium]
LALSLHSADQELREKLIPAAKRTSLVELREAMDEVVRLQDNAPIMIEYLMLRDVNDSLAQAAQLADYLDGLPALVNLIPYNPIAEAPHFQSTDRDGRERFGAALQERGFLVKIRFSLGADIDAACGQLAARTRE